MVLFSSVKNEYMTYHHPQPFVLESGAVLPQVDIAYTTLGARNEAGDNIIWVCHALTANADPADWWPGLVGPGLALDTERYYIVCANVLGSCYGSTGPAAADPATGKAYGRDFPLVTIRDMARAHGLLARHLGIERVCLGIGGSLGGQQLLEWAVAAPGFFGHLCLMATNAQHSPWGIAFNEAQRMAILADATIDEDTPQAGARGLAAARAVAMLSYRHYLAYGETQRDEDGDKLRDFRAASYQQYQGEKLVRRFNVWSYLALSRAMDSHHVARGRGGEVAAVLAGIQARVLVIGIRSDLLFPVSEQLELAEHLPHAQLQIINSDYGHDGFLVEDDRITAFLRAFLAQSPSADASPQGSPKGVYNWGTVPGTEKF